MNASEQKARVQLGRDEVESTFGTGFAEKVFRQAGGVDPNSWEGRVLARQHPEEDMRKKMYLAANSAPDSHIETLEDLLTTRAELARLVERESWGEVALEDKMARDPISVMTFLDSLNTHNRPLALADVEVLERAKRAHLGTGRGTKINAWDRDFYTDYSASTSPTGDISPFFSLGTCFVGLSQLFSSLYGIRFEVESVSPGECWDPLVRKLRVIDEEDGTIGTIYADLFARGGKASGAAHYTVRCSRRIDDDNPSDDFPLGVPTIEGVECAPEDVEGLSVEGVKWRGKEGSHQEPLIVLVCGFAAEGGAQGKCLLQWGEVETLFHEMGHAIHCTSHSSFIPANSDSNDRENTVPQRLRHPLRNGLCRAPLDPHGALPRLPCCPLLLRKAPQHRPRAPVVPRGGDDAGAQALLSPRDGDPDPDGRPGSELSLILCS